MGGLLRVMSEWKMGVVFDIVGGAGVLVFVWRWKPLQSDELWGCQQVVGEQRVDQRVDIKEVSGWQPYVMRGGGPLGV